MAKSSPRFAEWLTSTGRALGYDTNTALAKALGITQSNISRWKQGSRPGIDHLVRISELFGIELKSLLILAEYLPPEVGDEDQSPEVVPPDPIYEMIRDTPLGDEREVLERFWAARREEEVARMQNLIILIMNLRTASSIGWPEREAHRMLPSLLGSRLAEDVQRSIDELVKIITERPRPKIEEGELDETFDLVRPKHLVGIPIPEISSIATVTDQEGMRYMELKDSYGDIVGWVPGLGGAMSLLNAYSDWADRLTGEGEKNVTEEEGES